MQPVRKFGPFSPVLDPGFAFGPAKSIEQNYVSAVLKVNASLV
jgi:hypothetical protein